MLLLIAGLTAPTAGTILIGGRDVTNAPAQARNVGLVFQSYALFPHMTVFDNVAFPLFVRKVGRAEIRTRVAEALRLVRLEGFGTRKPSELSGGQQQRVALARGVVFKPDILLLDEPLGALDRKLRDELQVELKRLQRSLGVTTILVTHDQEEALSLSDRIVVLDHGTVQQIARPEEAYLRPANRFVADFLGIANFLDPVPGDGGKIGLVRPERVRLGPPEDGAFPATVTDAVYLGQIVRYHVRLDSGKPIVAVMPFLTRRFAAGDRVGVSWSAEDVWRVE
jgi:ABC-type Fe3+/spermidine/putrescine transport system ATPase subunit